MAKKRKLLIVSPWWPDSVESSLGNFIADQAEALHTRHEVAVLVPGRNWRWYWKRTWPTERAADRSVYPFPVFEGGALDPLRHFPIGAWWNHYVARCQLGIEQIIAKWGMPELIHAHVALPTAYAVSLAVEKLKLPVVVTEHMLPRLLHFENSTGIERFRQALTSARCVIAVSPSLKQEIESQIPSLRCEVLGNVIDTQFFSLEENSSSSERRVFLSMSRLSKEKNIPQMLQAAATLVEQGFRNFQLRIGGDGPEYGHLVKEIDRLNIGSWCELLGQCSRSKVREELHRASVYISLSDFETFGVSLAEAMSTGLPVITTRCGGPEFIVDSSCGIMIEPNDNAACVDAMKRFMREDLHFDPHTIRSHIVKRFAREPFLEKIDELYNRSLA